MKGLQAECAQARPLYWKRVRRVLLAATSKEVDRAAIEKPAQADPVFLGVFWGAFLKSKMSSKNVDAVEVVVDEQQAREEQERPCPRVYAASPPSFHLTGCVSAKKFALAAPR